MIINMMNNTKTALDIYQGGYVDNNIDFYNHLKDTVIREYKYFGFCELVDCLLLTDKITDIIVIASIINSANEFECKSDHLPKEEEYVPCPAYHGQRFKWSDCHAFGTVEVSSSYYGQHLLRTRSLGKAAHLSELKKISPAFAEL